MKKSFIYIIAVFFLSCANEHGHSHDGASSHDNHSHDDHFDARDSGTLPEQQYFETADSSLKKTDSASMPDPETTNPK